MTEEQPKKKKKKTLMSESDEAVDIDSGHPDE